MSVLVEAYIYISSDCDQANAENISLIEDWSVAEPKTKLFKNLIGTVAPKSKKVLAIGDAFEDNFAFYWHKASFLGNFRIKGGDKQYGTRSSLDSGDPGVGGNDDAFGVEVSVGSNDAVKVGIPKYGFPLTGALPEPCSAQHGPGGCVLKFVDTLQAK